MVNTALEYIRKNGEINRVLTLDEVPEIIDPESEDEDLEKIPQAVLMKFVSELPSGIERYSIYILSKKNLIKKLPIYWESMKRLLLHSFSGLGQYWRKE